MLPDLTLYFAYGSNMGASVMRSRCPRARQVGVAKIDGYRIGFTRRSIRRGGGVADLVPASDGVVWGAMFDLREDGFEALDEYEGVPTAYKREVREFMLADGSQVSASLYVVVSKQFEVPPSHRYWRVIVDGAKEAGLPAEYVASLEALDHAPE